MKKFFTLISIFACCAIGAMAQSQINDDKYIYSAYIVDKVDNAVTDGRKFDVTFLWNDGVGKATLKVVASGNLNSYKVRDVELCPVDVLVNNSVISFDGDGVIDYNMDILPGNYNANFGMIATVQDNKFVTFANGQYVVNSDVYGYRGWYAKYAQMFIDNEFPIHVTKGKEDLGYHYAFKGSDFTDVDPERLDVQGNPVNPSLYYIVMAVDGSNMWTENWAGLDWYYELFVKDEVELYPVYSAIYTDKVTESGTEIQNRKVTKLTSAFFSKATSATEVIIPASVSNVEPGCFYNSNIRTISVSNNNLNYVASADGKLLYKKNANGQPSILVAVARAAVKSGDVLTLAETCTEIADEAFKGYSGVTFVTKNPKLIYNESKLNGNSVESPNYTLSFMQSRIQTSVSSLVSNYVDRYSVVLDGDGMITADGVSELLTSVKNKSNVCYIDLTSGVVEGTVGSINLVGMGFNRNCVIYFPAKAGATGDNVVNGESCENLVLARESASPFYAPKRFTAAHVKVTGMGLKGNMVGYCLPFALGENIAFGDDNSATTRVQSAANVIRVCAYDGYDTTDNSIQLAYKSKLDANVPFFGFTQSSGATYTTIYAEDAEIDMKTGIAVESSDMPGLIMSGTYNASRSNDDYWLYVASGGVLVRTNDDINNPSVLKTFTGFFGFSKRSTVAQKLNNANIRVRFVEYDETKSPLYNSVDEVEDENTISVEGRYGVLEVTTYKSENVTIYNVAGAQVFNATVNGTETIELPSGVYVVNGNKYIVK